MDQEFLRREQAADYLQSRYGAYTRQTLAKLAVNGGGPRFRRLGRYPYYTTADLEEWARSRMSPLVESTSELDRKNTSQA